jgi:hypothetical protein
MAMSDGATKEILDLAALDDAGFDTFYNRELAPLLERFEASRRKAVAHFKQRMTIGAPIGIALTIAAMLIFKSPWALLIAGAVCGVVIYAIAYAPLQRVSQSVKESFLNLIADAIGALYTMNGFQPPAFSRFRALDLTPQHDRSRFEDHFYGMRHGCAFDLYEAHLERETKDKDGDSSWSTVFRGQLIRIHFPKPFLGVTVVRRDAGIFNGLRNIGKKFDRIGLADPKFERIFEVYGTDQVEARALVHPFFMERLLEIERAYEGKKVRCAFEDGDLLVAIEGGDKFEVGDMFKDLADPARAKRIVDDIAQILKLMDSVLTAETAHLIGR